jgi:(R,R)-butanediol dehydrogenase/meso-butanediol dehydrogenase/diacetyl reductase
MRAAIFDRERRCVSIERVADPEPGPDEVLIKVCRCGVCGSDVSLTGDGAFAYQGGQFGHEYAGEVLEVGREVTTLKAGDRIAALPIHGCGVCEGCRSGNPAFCTRLRKLNLGFGEYAALPQANAIRLPDAVGFADGCLIEPMACGLHAVRLSGMGSGARVLVLGAGAMSLAVVYWASRLGAAKVVVLSRSADRDELAMSMGADAVVRFDGTDPQRTAAILGGAPDLVFECVGKAGMLNLAIGHVRPQGTVLSMGMCMQAEPLIPLPCTYKEVKLLFAIAYTVEEFAESARAFVTGQLRLESMVGDVIGLDELPEKLAAMRAGERNLKVQVDLAKAVGRG